MPKYTTTTSDKSKKRALFWWKVGLFGLCGFEYFYVGKIKAGIIRFLIALFMLSMELSLITHPDSHEALVPITAMFALFWAIPALINLYKLKLGKFKDNVGEYLRA